MVPRNKIIEEAERKAKEIIENARKEAEAIVNEAERKWREKAEAERRRIISEAEREASYILMEARRTANILVNKTKLEVIDSIFEKAKEIFEKDKYDVKASLRNLLSEALSYVDKPVKIIVNDKHAEIAKDVLRELGYENVELEYSSSLLGGVIVISASGVIVDNSIKTRLEQARSRIINKLAKILWG
ncbi:MAG: V-type ATP synthase subunit E family protein [Desulfurococcaceae archaeon]